MSIAGITNYKPIPRAEFYDPETDTTYPNRERAFNAHKNVVPTDDEWAHMREQEQWDKKFTPNPRTVDIKPLVWETSNPETKQMQQTARRQLEAAIALVNEANSIVLHENIAQLEAKGKQLRKDARAALDSSPALDERLGNLQNIMRECESNISRQAAKVREIQSRRPPETSFPTEQEVSKWASKVSAAETKLEERRADYTENASSLSLVTTKRNHAAYILATTKQAIAVNTSRLNQLKRMAGIPVSEGKSSSYRSGSEFGLS